MSNGETSPIARRIRRWPRRVVLTVAIVVAVLVGARIALPFVVKKQINDRLATIPEYSGNVQRVGIHLWRGAYSLHDIGIYRKDGQMQQPFFLAKEIDFSVAWRDLFRGEIVSDIYVDGGELVFVKGPTQEASTTDADRRWQEVIQDIFPIDITHFELRDGVVRYIDATREPKADLFIKNMHVVATGLRNRAGEQGGEMPAQISIAGDSLGGGRVHLQLAAEPLAAQPHFEATLKVENVNLPALNESLRAFANVDVSRGTFQMAAEMAGRDGAFEGYVKPFFDDLDFSDLGEQNKNLGERIWERVVAGLAWLVKNKPRDQVATRIPFQGRFGDPQVGLWRTIANLFRHGFIQAFNPTVEGTISAEKVDPKNPDADEPNLAATKSGQRKDSAQGEPAGEGAGAPTGRPSEKKN